VNEDIGTEIEVSSGPSKYKMTVEGDGSKASFILGMAIVKNQIIIRFIRQGYEVLRDPERIRLFLYPYGVTLGRRV
jgi:5-enolpyruvylshikimate-3-phosphate synthase